MRSALKGVELGVKQSKSCRCDAQVLLNSWPRIKTLVAGKHCDHHNTPRARAEKLYRQSCNRERASSSPLFASTFLTDVSREIRIVYPSNRVGVLMQMMRGTWAKGSQPCQQCYNQRSGESDI